MTALFKRIYGHDRSESGKALDRLVFGCIVFGVILGAAITLLFGWLRGDANFEECMLSRMHGQPSSMRPQAYLVCQKRFP